MIAASYFCSSRAARADLKVGPYCLGSISSYRLASIRVRTI